MIAEKRHGNEGCCVEEPHWFAWRKTNSYRCSSDIWTPVYGDPHPNITSDIDMGVTISLGDMRLPQLPITPVVWGSLVIWGYTKAIVS